MVLYCFAPMNVRRFHLKQGLHARPCAELLKLSASYYCVLYLRPGPDKEWSEATLMSLMLLAAGSKNVELAVQGARQDECVAALEEWFAGRNKER